MASEIGPKKLGTFEKQDPGPLVTQISSKVSGVFSDFKSLGNSKYGPYAIFFTLQDGESIFGGIIIKAMKATKVNYFD